MGGYTLQEGESHTPHEDGRMYKNEFKKDNEMNLRTNNTAGAPAPARTCRARSCCWFVGARKIPG